MNYQQEAEARFCALKVIESSAAACWKWDFAREHACK
jgi:hypothetical protein